MYPSQRIKGKKIACKKCGSIELEIDFLFHDDYYKTKGQWIFICNYCGWAVALSEDEWINRRKVEESNYDLSYNHLIRSRNLFQKALFNWK